MTAPIPYSFLQILGNVFSQEEVKDLVKLPDVLNSLNSLIVRNDDYNTFDPVCASFDHDFALMLFIHYRYLWRLLGMMEDHPQIDWCQFIPEFKKLCIFSQFEDNGEITFTRQTFPTFRDFMYGEVASFRDAYLVYQSTGDLCLKKDFWGESVC